MSEAVCCVWSRPPRGVVGGRNSAGDFAVDISRVALRTWISLRCGYDIVPKILFGRPIDVLYARERKLPRAIVRSLLHPG